MSYWISVVESEMMLLPVKIFILYIDNQPDQQNLKILAYKKRQKMVVPVTNKPFRTVAPSCDRMTVTIIVTETCFITILSPCSWNTWFCTIDSLKSEREKQTINLLDK